MQKFKHTARVGVSHGQFFWFFLSGEDNNLFADNDDFYPFLIID